MEYWYWSGAKAPPWASLWTRRFQYTEYYDEDGSISFREYYDLRNDPWQLTNLLHDGEDGNEPDVAALHDRLTTDRACAGSACP
jgi:arylsulfatase A-like enzyme